MNPKINQLEKRIKNDEKENILINRIIGICILILSLLIIITITVSATNLQINISNNSAIVSYNDISNKYPCSIDNNYVFPISKGSDIIASEYENFKLQSNCIPTKDFNSIQTSLFQEQLTRINCDNNLKSLTEENTKLKDKKCYSLTDINNRDKLITALIIISIILFVILVIVIMASKIKKTIIVNHKINKEEL